MKKFISLFLISSFLIISCGKDEEKHQIWTVASERVDCMGLSVRKCYAVKREGDTAWSYFYDSIEGFTHEEGYEYVLKIKTEPVNEPLQDASSEKYILIETLSKTQKTSENLPETPDWE